MLRAIGSPGNSPFALTVGAVDDQGTPGRGDLMAGGLQLCGGRRLTTSC